LANSKNSNSDDFEAIIIVIIAAIIFGIFKTIAFAVESIVDFYNKFPVQATLVYLSAIIVIIFLLRLWYLHVREKASRADALKKETILLDNKKAQIINTIETAIVRKHYE